MRRKSDLDLLTETLEKGHKSDEHQMQELERIPLIRKITAPADVMDLEEIEHQMHQYCKLWSLYVDTSIHLKRTSKLLQEDAVTACKMYRTHISDVLKQFEDITKLFAIETELRIIRHRELIPIPMISHHESKIENKKDKDKILQEVDEELSEMLEIVRNIELSYEREKEASKKEQQARLARQINRPEFNTSTVNAGTPIKNTNTAPQTGTNQHQHMEVTVTFDPNPLCHLYPMTDPTSREDRYELPANNSIIKGATSAPVNQFMTNTTNTTGHNEPWRYNNRANTDTCTSHQICTTNTTGLIGLNNISPNSSDQRNGPKCYRCGEQSHMRQECKTERVYCTNCRRPKTTPELAGNTRITTTAPQTATSL